MITQRPHKIIEQIPLKGKVEIFVSRGAPELQPGKLLFSKGGLNVFDRCFINHAYNSLISTDVVYNIIVNQGKDKVIQALTTGTINQIGRVAVGDRGTIPSDSTIPKVPLPTFTTLYNEVYRADADAVTLDIGTDNVHEVKFIKTFNAVDVPIASFSNQTQPVINEVGLITYDASIQPLPRPAVASPNTPLADEKLFSIRTFKSVPFEAANEISVTIRYTIFIQ